MVSFDVASLSCHVLTTSNFSFNGHFYRQIDGVAMCLLLANFFMEDLEKVALNSAPLKTFCWFCYVDDTIIR
jgi:hypothetical protein